MPFLCTFRLIKIHKTAGAHSAPHTIGSGAGLGPLWEGEERGTWKEDWRKRGKGREGWRETERKGEGGSWLPNLSTVPTPWLNTYCLWTLLVIFIYVCAVNFITVNLGSNNRRSGKKHKSGNNTQYTTHVMRIRKNFNVVVTLNLVTFCIIFAVLLRNNEFPVRPGQCC